jgi:predicted TIM-barrel fold metal-dependent hydrolase
VALRPSRLTARRAGGLLALLAVVALGLLWWQWPSERTIDEVPPVIGFADIPKIDVHVHVPNERAASAVSLFDRQGVVIALNASGGSPGERLADSAAAAQRTSGRLLPYCNIDLSRVEAAGFAEYARGAIDQCREQGAVGLKIFKSLGLGIELSDGELLRVDDPRLDVVFERAGERGLPILIHTGDPQAFFRAPDEENERYAELRAHPSWSFYGARENGRPWPSWEELYDQFEARVARHPSTTFLGAHFANAPEDPNLVDRMLDRYPNLFVDTGARIPEIGRHDAARMRRFFMKHRDRILFGTDFQMSRDGSLALGSSGERPDPPERIPLFYAAHYRYFETGDRDFAHPTPIQGDWTIDGLDLPRDVLERIYHENAMRLFGLSLPLAWRRR